MHKRLLLASLLLFILAGIFIAISNVGISQNTTNDLSSAVGWAILDLAGLGFGFIALIVLVLGLALKGDKSERQRIQEKIKEAGKENE